MPEPKLPTNYACDEASLVDDGSHLAVTDPKTATAANVKLGWTDDGGRHFMLDHRAQLAVADRKPVDAAGVELGWTDDEGRHYVNWPMAVTDAESTEYVIPSDRRADAVVRRYDTRQGTSKQDWRLLQSSTCTARGGYTDALARFASGATMADIQKALSLTDKSQARALVHDAMIKLQRRYFRDN
jgi:hypothetical protein